MNLQSRVFVNCFLVLIIMFAVGTTTYADSNRLGSRSFDKRIAGTYLVREAPDQSEILLRLITLTADGNWFSIDAQQQSFGFTDQQGVWKRSGRHEITANVIDFNVSPGGLPTGVARIRFVMKFSKELRTVTGSFFGEVFALDQDPLDPSTIPIDTFESTFQGGRVTVQVNQNS
jgi:hypothetical protein